MDRTRQHSEHKLRCLGVYFILVIFLSNAAEGQNTDAATDDLCSSLECTNAVDAIKLNRKPGAKPCGDFYKFVCGGWQERNPIPPYETRWNQFLIVNNVTNYRIKGILETEDKSDDLKSIKKARKFYSSCLSTHNYPKQNIRKLSGDLSSWGGWPMISEKWREEKFKWQKLLVNLERTAKNFSPLFSLVVEPDRKKSSKLVISIDQADLPFCAYLISEEDQASFAKLLIATAFEFAIADNRPLYLEQLLQDTTDMLHFTVRICAIQTSTMNHLDEFGLYNPKTLRELQKLTDELELRSNHSKIGWLGFFNDYLDGSPVAYTENDTVIVRDFEYISQILRLIDATPPRVLANYLITHKITNLQKYLSRKFLGFIDKFDEEVTGQAPDSSEWWKDCLEDTSSIFGHAIGYEYVKRHFKDDDKEKVTELVHLILDSFVDNLRNNSWMDEQTKRKAVEKARNVLPVVGYPEWYRNAQLIEAIYSQVVIVEKPFFQNMQNAAVGSVLYNAKRLRGSVDRSEFVFGPAVTNAGYYNALNVINIPAVMLQEPFYVQGRPEALNYGAIGAIIGHELNHAFDIKGRTGGKNGNLVDLWTQGTLNNYLKETECFENQYNDYPIPELAEEEVKHLDGFATIGENLADNGGLQVAFQAYKKYVANHGSEPRLLGLSTYSPEQLFFIGYTTLWCENRAEEFLIQDILTDDHSPFKYRSLIALGNSLEFSNAWQCSKGSEMNPAQKCKLW